MPSPDPDSAVDSDAAFHPYSEVQVAVVGAGPAGLMAAECLADAGISVAIFEAKPSVGRKFLRAGIGGLNLTHAEPHAAFCARFSERQPALQAMLDAFPAEAVRAWAAGLGVETFVGSSGRVFPVDMKAAPLLRAWLQRLRSRGVSVHTRHRWLGWAPDQALRFGTPEGERRVRAAGTLLALGGGSWPQLGSDAAWVPLLSQRGVDIVPLQSANCGFEVPWSAPLKARHAGSALKPVAITFTDTHGQIHCRQGELVVSEYGLEGSLIYAFSKWLRAAISESGSATLHLDLVPGHSAERVAAELARPRGARSVSSHLQSRLGLKGVKAALLREVLGAEGYADMRRVAAAVKALPITLKAPRPLAEAISTAGGLSFGSLDDHLMLRALPGVFAAGEMLDWEAPTGGYLLTACLAQGRWAAQGIQLWLQGKTSADESPQAGEFL